MKDVLEAFLRWASVDFTVPEVFLVAHNCFCDRARILPIVKALLPHINMDWFKWVDTFPLLKSLRVIFSRDANGIPIEPACGRLSVLVAKHLPHLDITRAHAADFDVDALYQLVLLQYKNSWKDAKEALLQQQKVHLSNYDIVILIPF